MTVEVDLREILKKNFLELNFVATATGIKQEGGLTSAEIEHAREQENK